MSTERTNSGFCGKINDLVYLVNLISEMLAYQNLYLHIFSIKSYLVNSE